MLGRALDWTFRDRGTGRIVVAQWPNPPLIAFLAAGAAAWFAGPEGTVGLVLLWISRAALAWWGADELARGVNPWRRGLGLCALASLAALALRPTSPL